MIGNINTIDFNQLKHQVLSKVELDVYVLQLYFGEHRLDVEEFWELVNKNGQTIDRQLSGKFRKEFKLKELEGAVLIGFEKIMETWILKFNNDQNLRISSPDFDFIKLKSYKSFGDGAIDRPPSGFGI